MSEPREPRPSPAELRPGPAERINPGDPSEPRPAGSVILLRGEDPGARLEVLMLKRSDEASFMPGVWVFPGGALDEIDPGDGEDAYRACAARELAEEAQVELPDPGALVLFARWITPEIVSTRFDAWFFLALAPAGAEPRPDGSETTAAAWLEPRSALESCAAGELPLAFPTIRQLEGLAEFATAREALEKVRGHRVEPILPRIVAEGGAPRVVLPGEPGYDGA